MYISCLEYELTAEIVLTLNAIIEKSLYQEDCVEKKTYLKMTIKIFIFYKNGDV